MNTLAEEGDKVYQELHRCGYPDFTLAAISGFVWNHDMAPGRILWRGLAGYSLAGLFAVYSLYQTESFSRIASMSGSLWFPVFTEYAFSHEMKKRPERLYFSLGDMECRTKNPYLKTVGENAAKIKTFYAESGIHTVFQLNPGNHYKNAVQRTAAGISWLLSR